MNPTRTTPELITTLTTGWTDAMQQWWDQSQAALDPWKQAWETMAPSVEQAMGMPPRRHRAHDHQHGHDHGHGCDCGEHGHHHADSSCGCGNACHCCIPDADVVLHTRAGEQRVIPFMLRNPWRREREVTLAVGPWQVCDGGRLEVRSVIDAGESLTLLPCERKVVRLVVLVRGICDDPNDPRDPRDPNDPKDPKDPKDGSTVDADGDNLFLATANKRFVCDVESCTSAYADVRFEGCARPQRVAIVVHPASCDAIELPCDRGCCC